MEEEDTCRICRSGPEEDTPLYHPCKCSGSIAKVHQDCLIDWLQHSKKKSCELCNTELRFHKVYSPTMPAKLPLHLYVRRFFIQSLYGIRFGARAIFVAASWLAILPLMNLGIWRLHFMIVDVIIWSVLGGPPPGQTASAIANSTSIPSNTSTLDSLTNATSLLPTSAPLSSALNSANSNSTILNTSIPNVVASYSFGIPLSLLRVDRSTIRYMNSAELKKAFDKLGHDVFEGQMLTCAIVVCFVAIFLLREWCLQNMPQAVEGIAFAGEHIPPPPPPVIAPAPPPAPARDTFEPLLEVNGGADQPTTEEDEFKDELEDLGKRLASSTESIENDVLADATSRRRRDEYLEGSSNQPLRPRLTNDVVPIPPEIQSIPGMSEIYRKAMEKEAQEEQDIVSGNKTLLGYDGPLNIEEVRKVRSERFGAIAAGFNIRPTPPQLAAQKEAKEEEEADVWQDVEEESFVGLDKGKGREIMTNGVTSDAGPSRSTNADGVRTPDGVTADKVELETEKEIEALEGSTDTIEQNTQDTTEEVPIAEGAHPQVEVFGQAENIAAGGGQNGAVVEANDWEDEPEGADRLEDDLDGIMEAIGMRGPLYNLVTNLLMMFVLCSFVLAIAVALPYSIGRLFGVGSNFIQLVKLPVQGLRYVTDPAVDFLIAQGSKGLRRSLQYVGVSTTMLEPKTTISAPGNASNPAVALIKDSIMSILTRSEGVKPSIPIVSDQTPSWKEAVTVSLLSLGPNLNHYYAEASSILRSIYLIAEIKTQGRTQRDKIFCILLGQFYWLVSLFIQQRLSKLYVRMNLKWLKTSVEQQLVVLKVLAFICLELIIFPWCCGLLLDVALFPLWKDVSVSSRWLLMKRRPLSVSFTQWALGTLYMFSLAMFASTTRGVVRSGVLCFVRDAGDPTFHPIKDILERRALEQLRKIGLSGAIYATIMLATFGSCSLVLRSINNLTHILPLRWEMHQALSTTGVELLFTAIIMPPLVKSWLPVYILRKSFKNWWKYTAQLLRISSYLMGGRFPEEEGRHVRTTYKSKLLRQKTASIDDEKNGSVTFVKDGGFARVPADDHAIMSTPIVIHCDESGRPLTERGKEAFKKQSEAIAKMTKKPKYTIVYLPPNFKRRMIALISLLWLTICICFLTILLAPLLIGRILTSGLLPLTECPVHDGYSWIFGALLIGILAQLYRSTRRMIKSSNPRRRVLKIARRIAEYTWMISAVSLLSCLLGILVEQYINGISRIAFISEKPKMSDISLTHAFAMGLLMHHIMAQVYEIQPNTTIDWDKARFRRMAGFLFLYEIRGPQHRRPKVWQLSLKGILPATLCYITAISAPLAILVALHHLLGKPLTIKEQNLQIHLVYTACLSIFAAPISLFSRVATRWTALIRDEYFLISTELKNYPTHVNKINGVSAKHNTTSELHQSNGNVIEGAATDEGPLPDVMLNR